MLGTLDDFHDSFGTKAKITEFDLPSALEEELAGRYLRDFLTAVFSHESVEGFLFWSFWDGQTYINEGSNLYREDWTETPAHTNFVDLLFNEWWTDEDKIVTDQSGQGSIRAFKGKYEISFVCNGDLIRDIVDVSDDFTYGITCDNLTNSLAQTNSLDIDIYPNPSEGSLNFKRDSESELSIQIYDLLGTLQYTYQSSDKNIRLDLDLPRGMYLVSAISQDKSVVKKIAIEF